MNGSEERLLIGARATRDFWRSVERVAALGGEDPAPARRLGDPFDLVVDAEGLTLRPTDSALEHAVHLPWAHVGRIRNDWIRVETIEPLDVILTLIGTAGLAHTEVNEPVLGIEVVAGGRSEELRITLTGRDRIAALVDSRRPRTL